MSTTDLAIRNVEALTTFDDLYRMGDVFFRAGVFNDVNSAAKAIVKIQAGKELGIPPIAAMQGMFFIDGKLGMYATLMGGQIKKSGKYRMRVIEHDTKHCKIEFFEREDTGWESMGFAEFTEEDANRAGLIDKKGSNYKRYPKAMYFSRALSAGARMYCQDAFMGMPVYSPEELGAAVDMDDSGKEEVKFDAAAVAGNPSAIVPPSARPELPTLPELIAVHQQAVGMTALPDETFGAWMKDHKIAEDFETRKPRKLSEEERKAMCALLYNAIDTYNAAHPLQPEPQEEVVEAEFKEAAPSAQQAEHSNVHEFKPRAAAAQEKDPFEGEEPLDPAHLRRLFALLNKRRIVSQEDRHAFAREHGVEVGSFKDLTTENIRKLVDAAEMIPPIVES